jgi:hypothetical protein
VKLNELKQTSSQLNEGILGDFAYSKLDNYRQQNNGATIAKMANKEFINTFLAKASLDLTNAIKSGRIDPNPKANIPAATTSTAPTAPTAAPAGETPEQKRIRLQKAAQQNADKTATPFSKLPANQGEIQAGNIRQQKQTVAAQTAQAGMTPKPPVKPAVWRSGRNPTAPAVTRENKKFDKLNQILENIINVDEDVPGQPVNATGQQAAPIKQSISQYLTNWFTQYLKTPITDAHDQSLLKSLADQAQASYPNNKDALANLANLGYSILSDKQRGGQSNPSANPAAKKRHFDQQRRRHRPTSNPAANPTIDATDLSAKIKEMIAQLAKLDKRAYSNLIASL